MKKVKKGLIRACFRFLLHGKFHGRETFGLKKKNSIWQSGNVDGAIFFHAAR
ncbi:MAG: hypothetical protein QNK35_11670 [Bacteroides sp.]|nr:hypothetical protein [Bacteroides sp.]